MKESKRKKAEKDSIKECRNAKYTEIIISGRGESKPILPPYAYTSLCADPNYRTENIGKVKNEYK